MMYKISGGKQLKECLKTALEHNLSVLISGPPGCGKSEITAQAAAELGMPIDELRLYLMEPGEAKGLPDIRDDATYWTRPNWLPLPADGKRVLFFDDIHLASEQLQSPLFELLLCHRLHGHETSDETRFVAAGNLSLHSAGASELLAPVMDRFDIAIEFNLSLIHI